MKKSKIPGYRKAKKGDTTCWECANGLRGGSDVCHLVACSLVDGAVKPAGPTASARLVSLSNTCDLAKKMEL